MARSWYSSTHKWAMFSWHFCSMCSNPGTSDASKCMYPEWHINLSPPGYTFHSVSSRFSLSDPFCFRFWFPVYPSTLVRLGHTGQKNVRGPQESVKQILSNLQVRLQRCSVPSIGIYSISGYMHPDVPRAAYQPFCVCTFHDFSRRVPLFSLSERKIEVVPRHGL